MQARRPDNIRRWPYRGALDDAGYYCAKLRLWADMPCAVEVVTET